HDAQADETLRQAEDLVVVEEEQEGEAVVLDAERDRAEPVEELRTKSELRARHERGRRSVYTMAARYAMRESGERHRRRSIGRPRRSGSIANGALRRRPKPQGLGGPRHGGVPQRVPLMSHCGVMPRSRCA